MTSSFKVELSGTVEAKDMSDAWAKLSNHLLSIADHGKSYMEFILDLPDGVEVEGTMTLIE